MPNYATALVLIAVGCGANPETFVGTRAAVDGGSAGCDAPDSGRSTNFRCDTNADCIAAFAPLAPSGTLYATCFSGTCLSAEQCVATHAGAPDYCTCGSDTVYIPEELCVGASETDEPQRTPFCH